MEPNKTTTAIIGVHVSSLLFIENLMHQKSSVGRSWTWIEDQEPENSLHWDVFLENVFPHYCWNSEHNSKLDISNIDLLINYRKRFSLKKALEKNIVKEEIISKLLNLCLDNNSFPNMWCSGQPNYSWAKQIKQNHKLDLFNLRLNIINKESLIQNYISTNNENINYLGKNIFYEKILPGEDRKKQIILNAPNKALFVDQSILPSSIENPLGTWFTYHYKIEKKFLSGMAPLTIIINDQKNNSFIDTALFSDSFIAKAICLNDSNEEYSNLVIKIFSTKNLLADYPALKLLYWMHYCKYSIYAVC